MEKLSEGLVISMILNSDFKYEKYLFFLDLVLILCWITQSANAAESSPYKPCKSVQKITPNQVCTYSHVLVSLYY